MTRTRMGANRLLESQPHPKGLESNTVNSEVDKDLWEDCHTDDEYDESQDEEPIAMPDLEAHIKRT